MTSDVKILNDTEVEKIEKLMNDTESVEYTYEDYENYTIEDYGQYDFMDNKNFEFPPIVTNCNCTRKDIQYEQQTRRRVIINEGSIGGKPCLFTTETQDCECPDWGKFYQFPNILSQQEIIKSSRHKRF